MPREIAQHPDPPGSRISRKRFLCPEGSPQDLPRLGSDDQLCKFVPNLYRRTKAFLLIPDATKAVQYPPVLKKCDRFPGRLFVSRHEIPLQSEASWQTRACWTDPHEASS